MFVLHFKCRVSIVYFYACFCTFHLLCVDSILVKPTTKPDIKLKLISLEKCKLPASRIFKDAPLTYTLAARKVDRLTTIIVTNISVTAKEGPVFFNFRGYQVQQSSNKDLIFQLEKVTCNNPLTFQLIKVLNVKLDKSCYSIPGQYAADNIRIEDFHWIFSKSIIDSGQYAYNLEFATSKGVAACISLTCDITK